MDIINKEDRFSNCKMCRHWEECKGEALVGSDCTSGGPYWTEEGQRQVDAIWDKTKEKGKIKAEIGKSIDIICNDYLSNTDIPKINVERYKIRELLEKL